MANPYSTDDIRPGRPFLIDALKSDTVDLPVMARAISFVGEGAIAVHDENGVAVTIPSGALAAGVQHSIKIKRVLSTGTTATTIVGYA